jgi:hypothetical protein
MTTPTPPLAREAEPMSDAEMAALRLLAEKATPGPWHASDFCQAPATEKHPAIDTCKVRPLQRTALGSFKREDAEYIAALSPDVVLGLLATIATLKRERDEARAEGFRQGRDAAAKVMRQLREALPPLAKCSWNGACESGDQAIRALQPPKELRCAPATPAAGADTAAIPVLDGAELRGKVGDG